MTRARIAVGYQEWFSSRTWSKPPCAFVDQQQVVVLKPLTGIGYFVEDTAGCAIAIVPKRFIEFLDDTAPEADKP